MERKLTAILSADIKGYSRLMGEDNAATVRTLTAHRALMDSLIQHHRGRVVDSPGDNLLAEFASIVDDVQCAVEIQRQLQVSNAQLSEPRKMEFRIGINLGDVIVEGERLYGDGVNIAARLESLAEAGGICLSGIVYDQVKNKLALSYEDLGEQVVKNIADPVRVWRVRWDESSSRHVASPQSKSDSQKTPWLGTVNRAWVGIARLALLLGVVLTVRYVSRLPLSSQSSVLVPQETQAALPLPDKPSIAVLPFANLSGDPEQEYFSDGITETLITDLSRVPGLFVIARNSTFTYKDQAVDIAGVSRKLGVRYVLEGSVQKADDRVRINAQLVDATTGGHVWAERYDRELQHIFALQDELTQKIVFALKVTLTPEEQARLRHDPTDNLEAYDYLLRGWAQVGRVTPESWAQARQLFEHAIELDPDYAAAYASLGYVYWTEWAGGWNSDLQLLKQAFTLVQKAIVLDSSLPRAHAVLGLVYLFQKQHEPAVAELEQAIALDPNFADAYAELAHILTYAGRPQEAIGRVEQAMRLNPHYHLYYVWILGRAYNLLGRYEEAIPLLQRVITRYPDHFPAHGDLAVIYSELGRKEEAQAEVAELRRLNPQISLEWLRQMVPYKDQEVLERRLAALRKAGLK
jgi:adenylate cyclase